MADNAATKSGAASPSAPAKKPTVKEQTSFEAGHNAYACLHQRAWSTFTWYEENSWMTEADLAVRSVWASAWWHLSVHKDLKIISGLKSNWLKKHLLNPAACGFYKSAVAAISNAPEVKALLRTVKETAEADATKRPSQKRQAISIDKMTVPELEKLQKMFAKMSIPSAALPRGFLKTGLDMIFGQVCGCFLWCFQWCRKQRKSQWLEVRPLVA
jgi:hypothetical protein